jgi:hypothetical protein
MPKNRQLVRLEESIRVYEQVIRSFEHANEQMRQRRKSASDSVMVHIDDSLALNRRALDSLHRILESARKQLRQERSRAGSD